MTDVDENAIKVPTDPEFDLPTTASGDGGDSAAICGTLLTVAWWYPVPEQIGRYVEGETPVRHPNSDKWYGLPWRFSRDQLIGLLCGLIIRRRNFLCRATGWRLFEMHTQRWLVLAWNKYRNHVYPSLEEHLEKSTRDVKWRPEEKFPDICGPEVLALWIRFWRFYPLWPLLWILDLDTLFGSISWHWREDRVSRNHLLVLLAGRASMPTPVMALARWIAPVDEMILKWQAHCRVIGEVDLTPEFKRAFTRDGGLYG